MHGDGAYGWISSDRVLGSYFVHLDDVVGRTELQEGQRVRFIAVLVSGKPMVIACQKAGGHPGMYSAPVKWLPRAATPSPGRRS